MSYSADLDVRVTDSSLRDGSHAIRHQFTVENVRSIVAALDEACVPVIEVTHGDGLGGSSFNYGFSAVPDQDLISTAVATLEAGQDRVPDAARPWHHRGHPPGGRQRRLGLPDRHPLHEADIAIQHFKGGPQHRPGDGRLPDDAHSQPPEVLAKQARIMADAGAQCVYVVDSAGALIMDGGERPDRGAGRRARRRRAGRVPRSREPRPRRGQLGAGRPGGRQQIDGSTRRFGGRRGQHAGRGVRRGHPSGSGSRPASTPSRSSTPPRRPSRRYSRATRPRSTALSLTMGYAGVYSSFLRLRGDPGKEVRRVRGPNSKFSGGNRSVGQHSSNIGYDCTRLFAGKQQLRCSGLSTSTSPGCIAAIALSSFLKSL